MKSLWKTGKPAVRRLAALSLLIISLLSFTTPNASAQVGVPWAWGMDGWGEAGQGRYGLFAPSPVANPALKNAIMVGDQCAVMPDGAILAWSYAGGLDTPLPVAMLPGAVWASVALTFPNNGPQTYSYYGLALKSDGTLWGWGDNSHGLVGDGGDGFREKPVQVLDGVVQAFTAYNGLGASIAVRSDGTIWAWGEVENSTLHHTPSRVTGLTNVAQISRDFMGVLKKDGTLYRCKRALLDAKDSDIISITGVDKVIQISRYLALKSDGTVWQVDYDASIAKQVAGISDVVQISHNIACHALKSDGTVWAWGWGDLGSLGLGTLHYTAVPTKVPGLKKIVKLTSAQDSWMHGSAIQSDGRVWTWGQNYGGALGLGYSQLLSNPAQVQGVSKAVQSVPGAALLGDGTVLTWGFAYDAFGDMDKSKIAPHLIPGATNIVQIAYMDNLYVAATKTWKNGTSYFMLKSDGTLWVYGNDASAYKSAAQVAGVANAVALPVGSLCYGQRIPFIQSDGTAWLWDATFEPTVKRIKDADSVVQISYDGEGGYFVLKSDGTVWNYFLNDAPVQANISDVVQIATFGQHLALKGDGTVWQWSGYKDAPAPVPGLSNVAAVSTAEYSAMWALKMDGTVWGWTPGLQGAALGTGAPFWFPVKADGPAQLIGPANQNSLSVYSSLQTPLQPCVMTVADAAQPYSANIALGITLKSAKKRPAFLRSVSVSIDGANVGSGVIDARGALAFASGSGEKFGVGKHSVVATFAGDLFYSPASAKGTLTISKADVTLAVPDASASPGQKSNLTAVVRRKDKTGVSGANVVFSLDGVDYGKATTDSTGTAALPYVLDGKLAVGSHTIKATYAGDSNQNGSSGTGTLTLTQAATQLTGRDAVVQAGLSVTLSAQLTRTTDSAPLDSKTVRILVDGVEVKSVVTNGAGLAGFKYKASANLKKGAHKLSFAFDGDAWHSKSSDVRTLTVK